MNLADLDGDGKMEIIQLCSPNYLIDPNYGKGVIVVVDSRGTMLPGWPKVIANIGAVAGAPAD